MNVNENAKQKKEEEKERLASNKRYDIWGQADQS